MPKIGPDLRVRGFAGSIDSPNPFWLASAPPTNCGEQIMRAFDAGWGGAVWKTIGEPVTNVSSRYSATDWNGQRIMGFNNIELISDRTVEDNLREMAEVKKRYPQHAVIASLMVASNREAWHEIVARSEDAGADGLELNFGCPHGMSERGMGSAVGQVPEYAEMITEWVKEKARTPVLVKLTPNITDIRTVARAAKRGGADGLSAINTINSITGIDLDTFTPRPNVDGKSSHGGYCGPAVKPIALNMVQQVMADPECGAAALRHRRHRHLARCGRVHPARLRHRAGVHRGHALRLSHRRRHGRGSRQTGCARKASAPSKISAASRFHRVTEWKHLNLNYKIVARINEQKCIGCDLCHIACWDGAHQCIHLDRVTGPVDGPRGIAFRLLRSARRRAASRSPTRPSRARNVPLQLAAQGPYPTPLARIPRVDETECVGCNLCSLVCPVDECITMVRVDTGLAPETWEERTRGAMRDDPHQA